MKSLLLIGGGGHCRSCIDVIEAEGKYSIAGIVNQPGENTDPVLGYEVLGDVLLQWPRCNLAQSMVHADVVQATPPSRERCTGESRNHRYHEWEP